jgi:hypothetical protein
MSKDTISVFEIFQIIPDQKLMRVECLAHAITVEPLTADATRHAFGTNAQTGVPLPPRPDILFVDFAA